MDRIANIGSYLVAGVLLLAGCDAADAPETTAAATTAAAQGESDGHAHGAPGELGTVDFAVSCSPVAQAEFNRAAALLHSFWFAPAIEGFTKVAELDDSCAMAHWGVAMSLLGNPFAWPLTGPALVDGLAAVERAVAAEADTEREEAYINAVGTFYRDAATVDHATRAKAYAAAMGQLVEEYPDDTEGQIFYALSLDATAPPTDKTYANQKKAARNPGTHRRRPARPPRRGPLPDPQLRLPGRRRRRNQGRRALFQDRAGCAARPAHALAHLHPAR